MIKNLLDQMDIEYNVNDEFDEIRLFFSSFESDENRKIDIVFVESQETHSFALYLPEIIQFNEENRQRLINLINDENFKLLYGGYFIRPDQNDISFRISHSLENNTKITKSQINDYIGMSLYAADNIINILGEFDEKNK